VTDEPKYPVDPIEYFVLTNRELNGRIKDAKKVEKWAEQAYDKAPDDTPEEEVAAQKYRDASVALEAREEEFNEFSYALGNLGFLTAALEVTIDGETQQGIIVAIETQNLTIRDHQALSRWLEDILAPRPNYWDVWRIPETLSDERIPSREKIRHDFMMYYGTDTDDFAEFLRKNIHEDDLENNVTRWLAVGRNKHLYQHYGRRRPEVAEHTQFVVERIVPTNSVVLLAAASEAGKSTIITELAIEMALSGIRGGGWLGEPVNANFCDGVVALLTGEDSDTIVNSRRVLLDPENQADLLVLT
jgi:hypothetical protein